MADEEATAEEKSGGKNKMLMFGIIGVVLAAGGAVGGPMIMNMINPPAEEATAAAEDDAPAAAEPGAPAHYYPILPPLTSNFADEQGRRRFIQVGLEVRASEQRFIDAVKEHNAVIRNALLLAYSELDYNEVITRDGKESLRQTTLDEIRDVMTTHVGEPGIEDVYFTQFVIQ
ncbi:MAG: flagellar basal body-associated FliL family protein [Pseudomonadota bacterium]